MVLIQLHSKSGTVRGPKEIYSDPGFVQLMLEPYERVVQINWKRGFEYRHRTTVDWTWTVWIECRLS